MRNDQKHNELEIHDFYKELFKCKDAQLNDQSIDQFLGPENCQSIKKLSLAQKNNMKGTLTLDELTRYLKKTRNNVAPGSTGFTNEFFKFFSRDLKHFVVKSVKYSFDNNKLSASKSMGIRTKDF